MLFHLWLFAVQRYKRHHSVSLFSSQTGHPYFRIEASENIDGLRYCGCVCSNTRTAGCLHFHFRLMRLHRDNVHTSNVAGGFRISFTADFRFGTDNKGASVAQWCNSWFACCLYGCKYYYKMNVPAVRYDIIYYFILNYRRIISDNITPTVALLVHNEHFHFRD